MVSKLAVLGREGIDKYSLSPLIHTSFLKQKGIDGEYIAIPVKPEDLQSKLKELQAQGYVGVNLTIPHKVNVIPFLDGLDEVSQLIGAVNTIEFKDGKMYGYNTDAFGFIKQIDNVILKKPIVFGAGGAARAILYGLRMAGITDIMLCNRTDKHTEEVVSELNGKKVNDWSDDVFDIKFIKWEDRQSAMKDRDLLVNASSAGMEGNEPLDVDLDDLPENAFIYDIVYDPLLTPLLFKATRAKKYTMVNGIGMLLWQAAKAFEIWFGTMPEILDSLATECLEKLKENKK